MFDEGLGNSARQGIWATDSGHEVWCDLNGFNSASVQPIRFGGNNGSRFTYNAFMPFIAEASKKSAPTSMGAMQIYNGDGSTSYFDYNYYGSDSTGSDVTVANSYAWGSDSWAAVLADMPRQADDPLSFDWTSAGLLKRLLAKYVPATSGDADGRNPTEFMSVATGVENSEFTVDATEYPAPTLSSISVTPSTTTATFNVSTDTELGHIHWMVCPSAETPTDIDDMEAGAYHPTALDGGWLHSAVGATGSAKAGSISGLTSGTTYRLCISQRAAWANKTIHTSTTFTTT